MIMWYAEIKDQWGRPIMVEGPEGDQVPMTLRWAVVEALASAFQDEGNLSGEHRVMRWATALKVRDAKVGDDVELKVEELATIKLVIPKRFPQPFIIAQVFDLIEKRNE